MLKKVPSTTITKVPKRLIWKTNSDYSCKYPVKLVDKFLFFDRVIRSPHLSHLSHLLLVFPLNV